MNALRRGFTLIELLVVIGIIAVLAAMLFPVARNALLFANRADSAAHLKTVGSAIFLYASDHDGTLPGPLYPGQVMQYDPSTNGRIINILADYFSLPSRNTAYVVTNMIPRAVIQAMPGADLSTVRVYLMNAGVPLSSGTASPFGLATTGQAPLKLTALGSLSSADSWMAYEADQQIPYVITAPWKTHAPTNALHGRYRAALHFDGGVTFDPVTNS